MFLSYSLSSGSYGFFRCCKLSICQMVLPDTRHQTLDTRHCPLSQLFMEAKQDRGHHICPWYMAYLFDNPLRPLVHNPEKILGQYVKPGMTVLDIGCGMGFFSLGMARMVGVGGKVISIDLQEKMLKILMKRAQRRRLSERIESRLVDERPVPVEIPVDFALCFWVVHEFPDQGAFFRELGRALKPEACTLIAEPGMHVKEEDLDKTILIAEKEGFSVSERPKIRMCHSVVLQKIEH